MYRNSLFIHGPFITASSSTKFPVLVLEGPTCFWAFDWIQFVAGTAYVISAVAFSREREDF